MLPILSIQRIDVDTGSTNVDPEKWIRRIKEARWVTETYSIAVRSNRKADDMTSRTVIVALVACLVGSSVAMADELAVGFSEADLNDDGSLDVDEYLAAVIKTFATRDSNGNRLLTASELPEASPQGFSRIDRNGDATISVGEAAGDRIVRFFDADANHNGLLTLTELRRYIDTLDTETTR